jgi:redox-sensing transcriptional repressor
LYQTSVLDQAEFRFFRRFLSRSWEKKLGWTRTTLQAKMSDMENLRTESESKPSRPSAARLSLYLRCLEGWHRDGIGKVSSRQLAEALGISDAQVRRDLTVLGSLGQPGVGYTTTSLITAIRQAMGIDRNWVAVLVGAGNLGRALLHYRGFGQKGFEIAALFDADPAKIGTDIDDLTVLGLQEMAETVKRSNAELGILTVPGTAAQTVAETLVEAGIRGILNFAPVVLRLPNSVRVVNVDFTIQLEQLAFLIQSQGS